MGNRTYSIASIDDEMFDFVLTQKRIDPNDVKSFVDYDEQVIFVRERLQPDHKRELVLHELLHVCLEDAAMTEDCEKFVATLSPRLVSLVDDLPTILNEVV